MKTPEQRQAFGVIAMVALMLGACSDPPPTPTVPPEPQASEIQQALQQPLTATGVAIDQVKKTQAMTTDALDQIPPTGQPLAPPRDEE